MDVVMDTDFESKTGIYPDIRHVAFRWYYPKNRLRDASRNAVLFHRLLLAFKNGRSDALNIFTDIVDVLAGNTFDIPDAFIAIPPSTDFRAKRNYPLGILCSELSFRYNRPDYSTFVRRKKTLTKSAFDPSNRDELIQMASMGLDGYLDDDIESVLLIDDVYTTGSTLAGAIELLRDQRPDLQIGVFTFGITPRQYEHPEFPDVPEIPDIFDLGEGDIDLFSRALKLVVEPEIKLSLEGADLEFLLELCKGDVSRFTRLILFQMRYLAQDAIFLMDHLHEKHYENFTLLCLVCSSLFKNGLKLIQHSDDAVDLDSVPNLLEDVTNSIDKLRRWIETGNFKQVGTLPFKVGFNYWSNQGMYEVLIVAGNEMLINEAGEEKVVEGGQIQLFERIHQDKVRKYDFLNGAVSQRDDLVTFFAHFDLLQHETCTFCESNMDGTHRICYMCGKFVCKSCQGCGCGKIWPKYNM